MAIISAGAELNFDTLHLGALGDRFITSYSTSFARAEGGGVADNYWGNFVYNGSGELVGGTITQYSQVSGGVTLLQIYDVSLSVVDVAFGILNDIPLSQLQIFSGPDLITGSAAAKSASSPPHITVRTPFSAPAWPPETGASMNLKPLALAASASSRASSAEAVVLSISMAPGFMPAKAPSSP